MENTIKHQQNLLRKFYTAWVDCQTGLQTKEEEKEMHTFYQYLKSLITPKKTDTPINEDPDIIVKKGFEETLSFLVRNLEPEKIFLLPQYSDQAARHLLVVICDDEHRPVEELIRLQEHECLKKENIVLQLLRASAFENNPNIYLTVTCNEESLLYDNGYFALPAISEEGYMNTKVTANECFYDGLEKMQTFLEGAKIYQEDNPPMAAFNLHQAAEVILSSLLESITGKITSFKSLKNLIQSSLYLNPEILKTMGNGSKQDEYLTDLLEKNHSSYGHSNNYAITAQEVDTLITWVSELCTVADYTFNEWSARFDQYFLNLAEHE